MKGTIQYREGATVPRRYPRIVVVPENPLTGSAMMAVPQSRWAEAFSAEDLAQITESLKGQTAADLYAAGKRGRVTIARIGGPAIKASTVKTAQPQSTQAMDAQSIADIVKAVVAAELAALHADQKGRKARK